MLLVAAKRAKAASGRIVLSAIRDPLRDVFEVAGFNSIFAVHASVAEGIRSAEA